MSDSTGDWLRLAPLSPRGFIQCAELLRTRAIRRVAAVRCGLSVSQG